MRALGRLPRARLGDELVTAPARRHIRMLYRYARKSGVTTHDARHLVWLAVWSCQESAWDGPRRMAIIRAESLGESIEILLGQR